MSLRGVPPPNPARRNCLSGTTGPSGTAALGWIPGTGGGAFGARCDRHR